MEIIYNTEEFPTIQKAIDSIREHNGGTLIFPKGEYQTTAITLCDNLTIVLEKESKLIFQDDPMLYEPIWTRWEGVECFAMHPLIYAENAENLTIIGEGVIDGNGKNWWKKFAEIEQEDRTTPREDYELRLAKLNPDYASRTGGGARPSTQFLRPPLLQFWKSKNITLEGITIQNSPFWTVHTVYSENIKLNNLTIYNPADAINTDAIDIDSSREVWITNCLLDVGDDAVTLKSGSGADGLRINLPTENVRVENCKILASHGGIAIGSETAGGIKNVEVNNCLFEGTQRGVRLKSRRGRGGTIENIRLKNLEMNACWCPIVLSMYFAPGVLPHEEEVILSPQRQAQTPTTPYIQNVWIENIQASNVRSTAAFIVGLPEAPISKVNITDFDWSLANSEDLLETWNSEATKGLFHDENRGIKTINVNKLTINGEEVKEGG
ncbi:Glycosyl hydrolases family 28 [Pilibacter termitis]|uniref:Glycosyl hydrolases family 28 n=1 Tax=Pilibacter termitis TaxID=263852 RepID=A0A1T4KQT9_9ENTE|nr:glycoside hydrolase family 28 protein [Pilibacter termitis]SJZ44781.1 Glycosyl hydrolases family 28 [Pilibacter termitis]